MYDTTQRFCDKVHTVTMEPLPMAEIQIASALSRERPFAE